MLDNGWDMTIRCGRRDFRVHRGTVWSRSSYFRRCDLISSRPTPRQQDPSATGPLPTSFHLDFPGFVPSFLARQLTQESHQTGGIVELPSPYRPDVLDRFLLFLYTGTYDNVLAAARDGQPVPPTKRQLRTPLPPGPPGSGASTRTRRCSCPSACPPWPRSSASWRSSPWR